MIYNIYSIRDEVEDAYFEPQLFRNEETAKRYFRDLCNKEGTKIGDHAADFSIWYIGKFDMKEGQIDAVVPKLVERG